MHRIRIHYGTDRWVNEQLRFWFVLSLVILLELFFLIFFGFLLDVSLIVSLAVIELPIGVLFWMFFERRRSLIAGTLERIQASRELKHLTVHQFKVFHFFCYQFIENTKTHRAYDAPANMVELAQLGTIHFETKHRNEKALMEYFKANGVEFLPRIAIDEELA